MSSCSCSPESLVSVTFRNGTVLLRCPAHEIQRWLVDGRPVAVPTALDGLRSLFVEHRGVRAAPQPAPAAAERPAADRVIQLPRAAAAAQSPQDPARVDDAALTALLNARGLTGSWAVA